MIFFDGMCVLVAVFPGLYKLFNKFGVTEYCISSVAFVSGGIPEYGAGADFVHSLRNGKGPVFLYLPLLILSDEDSETTAEYFEKMFAEAIKKAKEYNVPLYCGEYGVIDIVSPEDTVSWFRTINSVFEKYGIARCAWSYKEMDFGLSDKRLDGVREELLKYL